MILGTFANLEAIDEKQAEIHDGPQLNPVADSMPFVEKLPLSVQEDKWAPQAADPRDSESTGKRKPNKTHKILPPNEAEQIAPPENVSVREVDLSDTKAKPQPIGPNNEPIPGKIKPEVKMEKKADGEMRPEMKEKLNKNIAEPDRSANVKVDSTINKDAIQKEEQEIAIDAIEDKQKSLNEAEKLLKEVKSELAKQNEETKKLVLQKIDKISEKVDKIEQLQEEEKQRDSAPLKKQEEPVENERKANEDKNQVNGRKLAQKEVPAPDAKASPAKDPEVVKDPIVEAILPHLNADQKANPDHAEAVDNIGRDLLSINPASDLSTKSRIRRNSQFNEQNDLKEDDNLPKNTVRLKNTVHPKYEIRRIINLRNAFKSQVEFIGPAPPGNRHRPSDFRRTDKYQPIHSTDDGRFVKYGGLDDSFAFHPRDKDPDDDNNDDVSRANDESDK